MNTELYNGISQILIQAILSIIGVLATYLITVAATFLKKKREELIQKIGAEQYNVTYNIAKSIYFAVEQQFRFMPQAGENKKDMFDKMLLTKIPNLKQSDLDHFREAVVGEINTQTAQAKLFDPAPIFNPGIEHADPMQIETK